MTAEETKVIICFHLYSLSWFLLLLEKVGLDLIIVENKSRFWKNISSELVDFSLPKIGFKFIVNTVLFVVLEHFIHRQSINVDFLEFLYDKFV